MVHAGSSRQPLLFAELRREPAGDSALARELAASRPFGRRTRFRTTVAGAGAGRQIVDTFLNEFWTSGQRQAHGLHEISYRACFKPQLPAFFVERLSRPGDTVYDPFMGRGTAPLEAALRGRVPYGNDVNPLSAMLLRPRLRPPQADAVAERLAELDLDWDGDVPEDLLVFYHAETLREICGLRAHLLQRHHDGALDPIDDWIRMVAVNRLTGHSPGFFSVYTLPPNQAVSAAAQRKINQRRRQKPPRRDVRALLLKKTRALLGSVAPAERRRLAEVAERTLLLTLPADRTPAIADASV